MARTRRHPLPTIILIAILGVICGADTWVDIALLGPRKRRRRATFRDWPPGIPSHDTCGRVLAMREAAPWAAGCLRWVQTAATALAGQVVALDGKTIRGSHHRASGIPPLHRVSACTQTNRLVLGPTAVNHKSHEITALPTVWPRWRLTGCMVTRDQAPLYGLSWTLYKVQLNQYRLDRQSACARRRGNTRCPIRLVVGLSSSSGYLLLSARRHIPHDISHLVKTS